MASSLSDVIEVDHALETGGNLYNVYLSQDFVDGKVRFSTKTYNIHKAVFAAQSKYFAAAFNTNFGSKDSLNLSERTPDTIPVFEKLIKFMYTGVMPLDIHSVEDVLELSIFLEINGAITACIEFILTHLQDVDPSSGHSINFWILSRIHAITKLESFAVSYICANFESIAFSTPFMKLSLYDQLILLKNDHIIIDSEDTMWYIISEILASSHYSEKEEIELLSCLKIIYLTHKGFNISTESYFYQKHLQICHTMVEESLRYTKDHPHGQNPHPPLLCLPTSLFVT